jgi:hypothetical protein
MKKLLLFLCLACCVAFAQVNTVNGKVTYTSTVPSGSCSQNNQAEFIVPTGALWSCQNGTWTQIGAGAGVFSSITINDTASNADLSLVNTTAGSSSSTNASPTIGFFANAYTGSASSSSAWVGYSQEGVAASGNGTTHLIFNRVPYSGSTGFAAFDLYNNGTEFLEACNYNGGSLGIGATCPVASDIHLQITSTTDPVYAQFKGNTSTSSYLQLATSGSAGLYVVHNISGSPLLGIPTAVEGLSSAANPIYVAPAATPIFGATSSNLLYGTTLTAGVSVSGILCTATFTTVSGGVTACTATSDPRLKTYKAYKRGLDAIMALKPIHFHWNEKGLAANSLTEDQNFEQVGFNARNVNSVMPEAVGTEQHNGVDYLSLPQGDRPIVAALVNAVQEQQAEILELKHRIADLEIGATCNLY